jgi:hypothetical protein
VEGKMNPKQITLDGVIYVPMAEAEKVRARALHAEAALQAIVEWKLPPSGQTHEDGSPMSFSYAYGSNGEQRYFQNLAQAALNNNHK